VRNGAAGLNAAINYLASIPHTGIDSGLESRNAVEGWKDEKVSWKVEDC